MSLPYLRMLVLAACVHLTNTFALKQPIDESLLSTQPKGVSAYPYMASLRAPAQGKNSDRHICGGVLIGPSHVLAQASCLFDKVVLDPEVHLGRAYSVASDQDRYEDYAEVFRTATVHFPPGWSPGPRANSETSEAPTAFDIAVVELERPSQFQPAALPTMHSSTENNRYLKSLGWIPAGARSSKFFLDTSQADVLPGPPRDTPPLRHQARGLAWAGHVMPASWCRAESGRVLVQRSAGGPASGPDTVLGIQSEDTASACWRPTGALTPRPVAFTPLALAVQELQWIEQLMRGTTVGEFKASV